MDWCWELQINKIVFVTPFVAEVKQESQGEIPYSLSRSEYLEFRLSALLGTAPKIDDNTGVYLWAKPVDNTIIMYVYHKQG